LITILVAISHCGLKEGSGRTYTKTAHNQPVRNNQKNIVIVDDDESTLTMYESFLVHSSNSTFKVKTFSQPHQALRYLIDHPESYDLVVIDIRMPKMSGFRLFQGLKAANPHAKVIFLSSLDAAPELLEIFPDIKPSQFIRKPVDRNRLIRAISEAIS
jgi:DNA-binding NtrC family response regulator